jgi:hypothetical protein
MWGCGADGGEGGDGGYGGDGGGFQKLVTLSLDPSFL